MSLSRRLKAFRLMPEAIEDILTGKIRPYSLPDGIRVERYGTEWMDNSAIIVLSHPDWPELKIGERMEIVELALGVVHQAPLDFKKV